MILIISSFINKIYIDNDYYILFIKIIQCHINNLDIIKYIIYILLYKANIISI